MFKLAIIAAERIEIAPLISGWKYALVPAQRHEVEIFAKGDVLVAFAGMGAVSARIAADIVYEHCGGDVRRFLSVGFAGALTQDQRVAEIVEPRKIIGAAENSEFTLAKGAGTLVSAGAVASPEAKMTLAKKYRADAVDMEASTVADVAHIYSVPFRAIKVISDEVDFPMPPMGRFFDKHGRFQKGSFIIYTFIRPWTWPTVLQLARNSSRAAKALCERLQKEIESAVDAASSVPQMSEVPR